MVFCEITIAFLLVLIVLDNLRLRRELKLLNVRVSRDMLTGLYNKNYILEQLANPKIRDTFPLSVIVIDLDNFKEINDSEGHLHGDACLSAVAKQIMAVVKHQDLLARWGGDEFIIILLWADAEAVEIAARRIRESVSILEKYYTVSVSVGAASKTSPDDSIEGIIQLADEAMYRDKNYKGGRRTSLR